MLIVNHCLAAKKTFAFNNAEAEILPPLNEDPAKLVSDMKIKHHFQMVVLAFSKPLQTLPDELKRRKKNKASGFL